MLTQLNDSKEAIKSRMLKHAFNFWGIRNIENLDPAIKLILEALSTELYLLGNEMHDTQVRIVEKLAGLLAPDFFTAPQPAHTILHATPLEPIELLDRTSAFYAAHKLSQKQGDAGDKAVDLVFSPVSPVRVFDVQLVRMLAGTSLYGFDASYNKQLISRSNSATAETNALWLGLRIHPEIETLDQLFFYFDCNTVDAQTAVRFHQLLPLATWQAGEQVLKTRPGIAYADTSSQNMQENIFFEYDLMSLVEKDVKDYYQTRLFSIDDERMRGLSNRTELYPGVFSGQFASSALDQLKEKLLWIKVVFPGTLRPGVLEEVNVYPNAFPVMNRQLNELKYRLKGAGNIIPLRTAPFNQFLSVASLTDELHEYRPVPFRKTEAESKGTYTIRNGGAERFDSRNAHEMIGYLLELLRSESAAFSAYGYDFIATTLKEMDQKITLMEQKTTGYMTGETEISNYIVVKPYEGQDTMYAEYWTTTGEAANSIRAGAKLQPGKGVGVKPESLRILCPVLGGRDKLNADERVNAFKYGIMTRNRIITREDIRNFCFYELRGRISEVEISRGVELSASPKETFRSTVDVILTPSNNQSLDAAEWQLLCEQIRSKLQTRSGVTNVYRVLSRSIQ